MTDNTNPQDLIALLRTFIGDTQIVRAAREAADLIEQQAARIAELEAEIENKRPILKWFNDKVWFTQDRIAELESRLGAQAVLTGKIKATCEFGDCIEQLEVIDAKQVDGVLNIATRVLAASEPKDTGN